MRPKTQVHGTPSPRRLYAPISLTSDDYALIAESLRIARQTTLEASETVAGVWPKSPTIERLRVFAEQMSDTLEKVEAL